MELKVCLDNYLENELKIDKIKFQKMVLLFNAIEEGWTIKKQNDSYTFIIPHENKKEILHNSYLLKFMKSNLDINKVFS